MAGYQHFGGGSDEPLKPYRSYQADLTSGPQRQSSLSDSLGGVERVRAWPEERQEDAAKVLLEMEAQDSSSYRLTDEQLAEVRRRRAEKNPKTLTLAEFDKRLRRLGI